MGFEMKETGLMFKAPLVRAILSGQKTQTRRICKPAQASALSFVTEVPDPMERGQIYNGSHFGDEEGDVQFASPYGGIGDRIYVRETFCYQWSDERGWLDECWFRATTPDVVHPDGGNKSPWKPAIHMPKHAARIWLEVTGVRVERLQDISQTDCIAEGARGGHGSIPGYTYSATPLKHFRHIWESTGGDWEANPWVWAIDFKRIDKPAAL